MPAIFKTIFLLILMGICLPDFSFGRAEKDSTWYIPAGLGIGPGSYSYHTLNTYPYLRIPGYVLGGRAMLFWENELVRMGPVFFTGTTRFQDVPNTNNRLLPGPCTNCYFFSGSRSETGFGGMFETNIDIQKGMWSFFRPLFGSEITYVRIRQEITSSYYFQGRQRMASPLNLTGNQNGHEFRLGFYLGAESRLNEFLSLRITSSLDISARNWTILPAGSFLFLPIPLEGTNLRLSPLHSLMICVRLK